MAGVFRAVRCPGQREAAAGNGAVWTATGMGSRISQMGADFAEEKVSPMETDDLEPRKPTTRLSPLALTSLGVAELRAYIAELRHELERTEAEISRKQSHRESADAFFRLSPKK